MRTFSGATILVVLRAGAAARVSGTAARFLGAALLVVCAAPAAGDSGAESPLAPALRTAQPAMVKIYGAGGYRGLEAYQSGFLISAEGHVLTAYSTVLDTPQLRVVLDDGRRLDGELLGGDAQLDVAVLKVDAEGLPHLSLKAAVEGEAGMPVLALSNMFGVATGNEPLTVQHGVVSIVTDLDARRGTFDIPYKGRVYVLDEVTSNPGAAGGALVSGEGRLLGMLGKELRNSRNNTWINYALPIAELRGSVEAILAGQRVVAGQDHGRPKAAKPLTLAELGLVLVPDVVARTPPYVEAVGEGSAAGRAGLRPDDLIVFLDDGLVPSCRALRDELQFRDRFETVRVTVLRDRQLLDVELSAEGKEARP
ncbi:MAG: S1C family serine protease [Thermoguttaceae bacterium]